MWRSIAAKSRQVARSFGAPQNPKKVPPSRPLLFSHHNHRLLSQFSTIANTNDSSLEPVNDSSNFWGDVSDAQLNNFASGDDPHAPFPEGFSGDGNAQLGDFDTRDYAQLTEGFEEGFGEDGDGEIEKEELVEEKVYEIDTEKLDSVLSLLQSTVDGSMESSLDDIGIDLREEFVLKVLETPLILGENLVRFFKWATSKPHINATSPAVDALVRAVCSSVRKRGAYSLRDYILEIGEKDSALLSTEGLNCLIVLLSKLGRGKAAFEIFNKFEDFGCVPNSDTYYHTIESLCRITIFDWGWLVCEKMLNARNLPDSNKLDEIISWFCKGSKTKEAHAVYLMAKEEKKFPPQAMVNNLVVSLCQKDENVKLAEEMLNDFPSEARKHAIKPFSSVIRGLCRSKDVDGAKQLLSRMIVEGPPPGNAVFNLIINGYAKGGNLEEAMKIVKLMERRGLKPDVYTYTVIMSGYASGGQMEEAHNVLSKAKKKYSKLCPTTYHTLIRGYCKLEQFDKALEMLAEMKEFGVKANVDEYNKLIQSLCLKAVDWRMAEKLLADMQENGLHLDGITKVPYKSSEGAGGGGVGERSKHRSLRLLVGFSYCRYIVKMFKSFSLLTSTVR